MPSLKILAALETRNPERVYILYIFTASRLVNSSTERDDAKNCAILHRFCMETQMRVPFTEVVTEVMKPESNAHVSELVAHSHFYFCTRVATPRVAVGL
jgi:hypothetical protein